jgi:hypothetical protein
MSSPSIAIGGMCCSLFMANQYMPELRILREGVIYRQDGATEHAEDDLRSLFD